MTVLSVIGRLGVEPAEVTWEDGKLSGTEAAVMLIEALAETGVELEGAGGMPDAPAGLAESYPALLTIRDVFDSVERVVGEAEVPDDGPQCAIR